MPRVTNQQPLAIPAVDLTQIPFDETVAMLRSLGQRLLTSALAGTTPPPLLELLSGYCESLLRQWTLHRSRQRQRQVGYNAGQQLGAQVKLTTGDTVLQARSTSFERTFRLGLAGSISQVGWYARLQDEIEQQMEIVKPPFVAADFWTLLGLTAWGDLSYQRYIVAQLWDYFRPRVLCSPADFVNARLAPSTFWALIGLSTPGTLSGMQKLENDRRLLHEAILRLHIEAAKQALVTDWAGFWDQWVLAQAAEIWTRELIAHESPLLQAVRGLPLMTGKVLARETQETPVPAILSTQNWEQEVPSWYPSWRAMDRE